MKKYTDCSDESLIEMYRDGDKDASDCLIGRYKALVKSIASQWYILGAEPEDAVQEGTFGLFKAIRDYAPDKGTKFSTFAGLCIKRQIQTAMESANRNKNIPLNTYISIYTEDRNNSGDDSRELIDEYVGKSNMNPEQAFIDEENSRNLEEEIKNSLSKFEREVFIRQLQGKSYREIAKELGCEAKACDNAIQRIKGKIKKIVKS